MTDEKWEEIKEMVKKNFGISENEVFELPKEQGNGTKEELIFTNPLGKIKLELFVKPLVLSKKTHYSKRMGATAKVDYITSETEKVRTLKAYKWDEPADAWAEIDVAQFGQ